MKRCIPTITALLFAFAYTAQGQRSDIELNRDSILDWRYVSAAQTPQPYKPIKDNEVPGSNYTAWQQQAADMLFKWVQQSWLPKGLVIRNLLKENQQWWLNGAPALHSYGIQLAGFPAHFVGGKLDLHCCEIGQYLAIGFNSFPGDYLRGGFNPDGLFFFAEIPPFTTEDEEAKLTAENIDKQILPNLHPYRTYLDHYHNNGKPQNMISVVVAKNGEWPFKPVRVKDIVDYITRQLAAYPGIQQKNPYEIKAAIEALTRLKPYYNEVAKLKGTNFNNAMLKDDNGHAVLDPTVIINGLQINKPFPEYRILVSTTRQIVDQAKTDKPLWLYINFSGNSNPVDNPGKFEPAFSTEREYMVNTLLRNFNFDYVSKWLADPEKIKNVAYTPVNAPRKTTENNIPPTITPKNTDPYTLLYENFEGYPTGTLSAQGWHTYGHDGHDFKNASLGTLNGQQGKWVSIPDQFSFYPNFEKPLPATFTVNYDICFTNTIQNKRTPIYFRLDTKDPNPKKSNPIDLHDINRSGFQFAIALSGETESSKRFMDIADKETIGTYRVNGLKPDDVVHITISVNGPTVVVTANGKEVMKDEQALPAGKAFKRYGWYCGEPGVYLGNILVKSSTPVQNSSPQQPQSAGVVKDPKQPSAGAAFQSTPYTFTPLPKPDNQPQPAYPGRPASIKLDYKFPTRSPSLASLPNSITSADGFKKLITNIQTLAAAKLKPDNTKKIDGYLQTKKATTSRDISKLAINAWIEGKPTLSLYLFCKALQADYTDLLTANNLASLLIAYGYADQAIPLLQYINQQTNGASEVLANLANAYYNLGDPGTAADFADKCIAKDSLNPTANKVAAYAHLNKAAQSNNNTETEKAIACLKQALRSGYDKEASDILGKIESNHKKSDDYANTNFKAFPMLKRLEMPAMPEDLHQMRSFLRQLELEKASITKTKDEINVAYRKIPAPKPSATVASLKQDLGAVMIMTKAVAIIGRSLEWYIKMKKDLEDAFLQNKKNLTDKHNEKMKGINTRYNAQLKKLEGGEGRSDEDEQIENLRKAWCSESNEALAGYLSDMAKLTNKFAQQSESVSRIYCRDLANWAPMQQHDNSHRPFLEAERTYLGDVYKILSFYTPIEPCIYPTGQTQKDNTTAKPKKWEETYCANVKGTIGLGPAKISFNCTSMTISGGEGLVGELNLNYNENGTFKDVTIGAGVGVEWSAGRKEIAAAAVGAAALEYITISSGPQGPQVTEFGISAGASLSGGVYDGAIGEDLSVASITVGFISGSTSISGAVPDALGLK